MKYHTAKFPLDSMEQKRLARYNGKRRGITRRKQREQNRADVIRWNTVAALQTGAF
jgi:hypothetical protein